jgi:DNA adenine methylase
MKYVGSKNRIAKEILKIMLPYRKENTYWVEPFVGGGNLIDKVDGFRIGSDKNKNVIDALLSIKNHIDDLPKNNLEFSEIDYNKLKDSDNNYLHKAYASFAFSYGGKYLGGWCRDSLNKRDYVSEAYKNAVKQNKALSNVELYDCDYKDLIIPEHSVIYCDPPYENSQGYNINFNHLEFWDWVEYISTSNKYSKVFVSEYNAPKKFECLYSKEIASSLTKYTGSKKAIEKLFTFSG